MVHHYYYDDSGVSSLHFYLPVKGVNFKSFSLIKKVASISKESTLTILSDELWEAQTITSIVAHPPGKAN